MTPPTVQIIAVDGHDCSGKTTLARRLAEQLGGVYARPFTGDSGARMVSAWRKGDEAQVRAVASHELAAFGVRIAGGDGRVVCDRYIVSALALIGKVIPLPAPRATLSLLCTVDVETVFARERARGAPLGRHERGEQDYLIARYDQLRQECNLVPIDSVALDPESALDAALSACRAVGIEAAERRA